MPHCACSTRGLNPSLLNAVTDSGFQQWMSRVVCLGIGVQLGSWVFTTQAPNLLQKTKACRECLWGQEGKTESSVLLLLKQIHDVVGLKLP